MNKTPRSVNVYIGRPEGLEDSDLDEDQVVSPDECYTITFIEEGGDEGFDAQITCLCTLGAAAEAWLTGKTDEEVQEIMSGHGGGDDHGDPVT